MHDILKIKNLNKNFGGVIATKKLNLTVLDGELHAIIGPYGDGITSLVSQIFGLVFPDSGQIFFEILMLQKFLNTKNLGLELIEHFKLHQL